MEIVIKVQRLGCGRVVAKVEPVGPVVEAEDVKTAHQSFMQSRSDWLPGDAWDMQPVYRVEG